PTVACAAEAWLLRPPPMVLCSWVAEFWRPPAMVVPVPLDVLVEPPPTEEDWPPAMLSKPPEIVLYCPDATRLAALLAVCQSTEFPPRLLPPAAVPVAT